MSLKNELHIKEFQTALLSATTDPVLLDKFLRDLLTPSEYRQLVARWQIAKLLKQGLSHRFIAERLKVGISTVTRGSRTLLNPEGGFNRVLQKLK